MVETKVYEKLGSLISEEKYMLVKKAGVKGDTIPKHNHPTSNILFTVVKGKLAVTINEDENFEVYPGKVLSFDGDNYISATMLEDSEIFITLINK